MSPARPPGNLSGDTWIYILYNTRIGETSGGLTTLNITKNEGFFVVEEKNYLNITFFDRGVFGVYQGVK